MKKKVSIARMGRPRIYSDSTVAYLSATGETRLQSESDRRAVVDLLVKKGGKLTLAAIDKHFGFNMRPVVFALARSGWLKLERK